LKDIITDKCTYGVFGHKILSSTKEPYLQGYVEFKGARTRTAASKLLAVSTVKERDVTIQEAKELCMRDDENYYECKNGVVLSREVTVDSELVADEAAIMARRNRSMDHLFNQPTDGKFFDLKEKTRMIEEDCELLGNVLTLLSDMRDKYCTTMTSDKHRLECIITIRKLYTPLLDLYGEYGEMISKAALKAEQYKQDTS